MDEANNIPLTPLAGDSDSCLIPVEKMVQTGRIVPALHPSADIARDVPTYISVDQSQSRNVACHVCSK